MPKYYFRANMCITFTLECEENTLVSDIKILFANKLNISSNDITMTFMPLNQKLKDNDKIGSFPPIERSFIFIKFSSDFILPDLSNNKMLKIANYELHEKNYGIPFEYEEKPTPREFKFEEYTIFSDYYQMHKSREPKFNYTDDDLLGKMSQMLKKNDNSTNDLSSTAFFSSIIDTYKKNDIEKFKESLALIKKYIDYEIRNSQYPQDNFDDISSDDISNFTKRLCEHPQIFDKIIKSVHKDSPEAANFLKNEREKILRQLF